MPKPQSLRRGGVGPLLVPNPIPADRNLLERVVSCPPLQRFLRLYQSLRGIPSPLLLSRNGHSRRLDGGDHQRGSRPDRHRRMLWRQASIPSSRLPAASRRPKRSVLRRFGLAAELDPILKIAAVKPAAFDPNFSKVWQLTWAFTGASFERTVRCRVRIFSCFFP